MPYIIVHLMYWLISHLNLTILDPQQVLHQVNHLNQVRVRPPVSQLNPRSVQLQVYQPPLRLVQSQVHRPILVYQQYHQWVQNQVWYQMREGLHKLHQLNLVIGHLKRQVSSRLSAHQPTQANSHQSFLRQYPLHNHLCIRQRILHSSLVLLHQMCLRLATNLRYHLGPRSIYLEDHIKLKPLLYSVDRNQCMKAIATKRCRILYYLTTLLKR